MGHRDIYRNDILRCMDIYQKDYYKECTFVSVLYSKFFNPILTLFGKNVSEITDYEIHDTYAYRTTLHYYHSFTLEYPYGIEKERLIEMLLDRLDEAWAKQRK